MLNLTIDSAQQRAGEIPRTDDAWAATFATLPRTERGEIDARPEAAARWTPEQLAAWRAEDDARMVCEASGHWLDVVLQNIYLPDGDDAPLEARR